jgi:sortase B
MSKVHRTFDFLVILSLLIVVLFSASIFLDMKDMQGNDVRFTDWDELKKTNPDIVAWLIVEGTSIDNPVVQGKDNFEYLEKDFYGNEYAGGTLFLDSANNPKFEDTSNIIYGHNMENGLMFGDLIKFLNSSFMDNHHTGTLETPDSVYRLEIVAAFHVDAYDRFYNPGQWNDYQVAMTRQHLRSGVNVSVNDKMLILSTCTTAMTDDRTVVICKMYPQQ